MKYQHLHLPESTKNVYRHLSVIRFADWEPQKCCSTFQIFAPDQASFFKSNVATLIWTVFFFNLHILVRVPLEKICYVYVYIFNYLDFYYEQRIPYYLKIESTCLLFRFSTQFCFIIVLK